MIFLDKLLKMMQRSIIDMHIALKERLEHRKGGMTMTVGDGFLLQFLQRFDAYPFEIELHGQDHMIGYRHACF